MQLLDDVVAVPGAQLAFQSIMEDLLRFDIVPVVCLQPTAVDDGHPVSLDHRRRLIRQQELADVLIVLHFLDIVLPKLLVRMFFVTGQSMELFVIEDGLDGPEPLFALKGICFQ